VRNIEIKATTAPVRALTIAAPIDGRIVKIGTAEGSAVSSGQVLITLSNPSVARDCEFARAQVALAESNLRGQTPRPVQASNASVGRVTSALELVLANKRTKLARYRELRRGHDVTVQELEDAENEYAWAERDYANERASLVAPPAVEPNRRVLELELAKARAEEKLARERRAALQIASPLPGTVTAVRGIEGQMIYARDPLVDVTDVSTIEVRGEISPDLLRYVHAGTPVEVKVFSVPPQTFRASIDHVVSMQAGAANSTVVVRLRNDNKVIQPNTPARITAPY
jgi:multidrug resistance efflux pump